MKILIVLALLFSSPHVEANIISKVAAAQSRWLQRFADNGMVQKALRLGIAVPLCFNLLSCSVSKHNPDLRPEAESQALSSQTAESDKLLEHASPEAFQPAQVETPDMIMVGYRNGLGGIKASDINDYMQAQARDELPAAFFRGVVVHFRHGENNYIGVAYPDKEKEGMVQVVTIGSNKLIGTINTNLIDGIYVVAHKDYGDHYIKFSAMHMQSLQGRRLDKQFGWSNLLGKTRLIFSNGEHVVQLSAVQVSTGVARNLSPDERLWVLVPEKHIKKINRK